METEGPSKSVVPNYQITRFHIYCLSSSKPLPCSQKQRMLDMKFSHSDDYEEYYGLEGDAV
jgi:hypothetical protein